MRSRDVPAAFGIEHEPPRRSAAYVARCCVAGTVAVDDFNGNVAEFIKTGSLHVDLRRADEVNVRRFAIDVDLHAIEFRWRTAFDEIAAKPDARRLRQVLA